MLAGWRTQSLTNAIKTGLRPAIGVLVGGAVLVGVVFAPVNLAPASEPSFARWRLDFRAEALRFGIGPATFARAFDGIKPDLSLPDLAVPHHPTSRPRGQAEFVKPPQAYLDPRMLARLTARGRALYTKHRRQLEQIRRELGVAPEVVLAIWGRETAFGGYRLPHNAIRALATQAYIGRRRPVFRRELLYALKLIEDGIATRAKLRSSWAGAIGMTQFMPSEYFDLAYDLDRDGRKDIWSPGDALASAANQLRDKGWQSGQTWGFEVELPKRVTCAMDGPGAARTINAWARLGVMRSRDRTFPNRYGDEIAFLFTPGGGMGPAFLVLENFMVFKRYNPSDLYALFVGHLADRIAGGTDFAGLWRNIRQLRTTKIAAIQRQLKQRGFAISKIDGKIGANTRSQIGRYQVGHGLRVDCWPSAPLLRHMRANRRG